MEDSPTRIDHLREYQRERRLAQIALAVTWCVMLLPVYLSIIGMMPWWSTFGIFVISLAIFFVSWVKNDLAPLWAYFRGIPIAGTTARRAQEIGAWFQEHGMVGRVYLPDNRPGVIHFRSERDATLFKLTWGGTN